MLSCCFRVITAEEEAKAEAAATTSCDSLREAEVQEEEEKRAREAAAKMRQQAEEKERRTREAEEAKRKDEEMRAEEKKPHATGSDWFSQLFGFREESYETVQQLLRVVPDGGIGGDALESTVNRKRWSIGKFDNPALAALRTKGETVQLPGRLRVSQERGDVTQMHALPENRHATFQVASQFNCLEFVNPHMIPEQGITQYVNDKTQGPACAIACSPATVFRNYFVTMPDGSLGQRRDNMLDNLCDFRFSLGTSNGEPPFAVRGGYTFATEDQLANLTRIIESLPEQQLDAVRASLRIGVHEDVEVTATNWGNNLTNSPHQLCTQVLASACACAYNNTSAASWRAFATLVLEASYEAAFWAAVLAADRHRGQHGSHRIFLTALGGGVFGNDMQWIASAIRRACKKFESYDLDVRIVTYAGAIDPSLRSLVDEFPT